MNSPSNQPGNRVRQYGVGNTSRSGKLSVGEIDLLRAELICSCPQFDRPALAQFVSACFKSDETVRAYFKPMHLPVLTKNRVPTGKTTKAIPLTHALRAARAARDMEIMSGEAEHHKKLAFLAALLIPSGLFLNALLIEPYIAEQSEDLNPTLEELRMQVLGQPLQDMARRDRESAVLLVTTLGFRSMVSVNDELASRLEAAVCLATLSVNEIWRASG